MRVSFILLMVVAGAATASAKIGFGCEADIHSVATSETRVVFVVSGPCSMLLGREPSGAAEEVHSFLRKGVIILHRTHEQFPSTEAWQQACKEFEAMAGKHKLFQTSFPGYTWENDELEIVSTHQLRVSDHG